MLFSVTLKELDRFEDYSSGGIGGGGGGGGGGVIIRENPAVFLF